MEALVGKVVAVAGAGNSVGRAVLAAFAAAGALTCPIGDDADGAQGFDPLQESSWADAFGHCRQRHGGLHVFVNARHRVARSSIDATTLADFSAAFDDLATAAWLAQKQAILALREGGGGVIVNVLPVLARVAAADCAALCAAARGVLMSTKSAALECARAGDGIIVSAVLAGRIDGDPDHWPDARLLPGAPAVTPAEVAAGALFLATDGAAYMTGVELPVDGGFLAC